MSSVREKKKKITLLSGCPPGPVVVGTPLLPPTPPPMLLVILAPLVVALIKLLGTVDAMWSSMEDDVPLALDVALFDSLLFHYKIVVTKIRFSPRDCACG